MVAPLHGDALLSAVAGVGGEDGAVTGRLRSAAANLRQAEAEVGLPLHHVVTHLRHHRGREGGGRVRTGEDGFPPEAAGHLKEK